MSLQQHSMFVPRCLSLIASLFLMAGLATTACAQSPTGSWDVNVDAGGSDNASVLTVTEEGEALAGTFSEAGETSITLQSVDFDDGILTFSFRHQQHGAMSGRATVEENSFSGRLSTDYGSFPMEGTRKAPPAPNLSIESQLGTLMENEAARAILDKHVPGMTSHPQIGGAAGMSLVEVANYAGDALNEEVLQAIDEELSDL